MKHTVTLTITSLLSILFTTFHLTDDFVRGISPAYLAVLPVMILLAVWLYGTLVLQERRSGYVIVLVFSLLSLGAPILHMIGRSGLTAGIKSSGGFFFAFTLMGLGITATFSVILSGHQLWNMRRG
jgi:hypothetical protein